MRIISGKYKSRLLKLPANDYIRPTTDRAKETLFNILTNKFDFENLVCLDLFCGTGSFGLECISRGASLVYFVDRNVKLAEENISKLNAEANSLTFNIDAIKFLREIKDVKADIAFADPPYSYKHYDELLGEISILKLFFVLEHSENFYFKEGYQRNLYLQKKIGITYFTIFDFNN